MSVIFLMELLLIDFGKKNLGLGQLRSFHACGSKSFLKGRTLMRKHSDQLPYEWLLCAHGCHMGMYPVRPTYGSRNQRRMHGVHSFELKEDSNMK